MNSETHRKKVFSHEKIIYALILVILGILSRTLFHFGNNVEYVTSASLLAGSYLGLFYAFTVPFLIMLITDIVIGNSTILVFTWSGFFAIGFIGFLYKRFFLNGKKRFIGKVFHSVILSAVSSIWFFLWTNFGVWLLDGWGMYSKDLKGLADCYILGLPFLRLNLIGNLFFVPLSFFIVDMINANVYLPFLKPYPQRPYKKSR